jgi:hypothetical protein
LLAIIRKISLPVSAHEWADSATNEADPVRIAAKVLATAISRFAPKAIRTVRVLSVSVGDPTGTIASGAPPILRSAAPGGVGSAGMGHGDTHRRTTVGRAAVGESGRAGGRHEA